MEPPGTSDTDREDVVDAASSSGQGCKNLCDCKDERCCLCRLLDNGNFEDLANVPIFGVVPTDSQNSLGLGQGAEIPQELHCVRCQTVPFGRIFQCHKGHIICEGCYQVQVLDKMRCEALGTCPKCSVRMYRHAPNRNIAAERVLAEMQMACEFCGAKMLRPALRSHYRTECPERLVFCEYRRIGCPWYGRAPEITAHDATCEWPEKTSSELTEFLLPKQAELEAKTHLLEKIRDMMQLLSTSIRLLHILPQGLLSQFPHNEFVAVTNFRAFFHYWSLLLMWQTPPAADDDNPLAMGSLHLRIRLDPPEDWQGKLSLSYTLVHGTHSAVALLPNLCERFLFTSAKLLGPPAVVYRHTMAHCKKLLVERGIYVRLLMAQLPH